VRVKYDYEENLSDIAIAVAIHCRCMPFLTIFMEVHQLVYGLTSAVSTHTHTHSLSLSLCTSCVSDLSLENQTNKGGNEFGGP
jgi:ABC-type sulfate transport system permease component